MNTIITVKHNILKKDNDGYWYSIPENMVDSFIQLSESVQNAQFMSDAWYAADDEFSREFNSYRKGD